MTPRIFPTSREAAQIARVHGAADVRVAPGGWVVERHADGLTLATCGGRCRYLPGWTHAVELITH